MSEQPGAQPSSSGPPPDDVLGSAEAGGKAIRGAGLRIVAYVVGILLTLVTVPLMLRHLGVVDSGRFITVTSMLMIVAGVTEAGLSAIAIREFTLAGPSERRSLVANLVGIRIALTGAGVLLACGLAGLGGYGSLVAVGVAVSGVGLVLSLVQQTYVIPLAADLRWGLFSVLDLSKQAVTALLVGVLVLAGAGLGPFFLIAVVSSLVALVLSLALVRDIPWRPAVDLDEWRRLGRDALPYAAAATIGIIFPRIAIVAMTPLADERETGYFGAALRVVEAVGGIPWILVTTVFPILTRAARDDQDRLRYALQRVLEVSLILGGLFALAMAIGAPFVIDVVAGSEFGPSVDVLRIEAVTLAGGFLVATWATTLLSLKRHGDLLRANAVALVVAVIGTAALVPPFGAIGGAVATVGAELTLAAAYGVLLVRHRPDLRGGLGIVPRLAAALAVAVPLGVLLPVPSLVAAVAASAAYLAVLVVLGAVPPELRQALLQRRRPSGEA